MGCHGSKAVEVETVVAHKGSRPSTLKVLSNSMDFVADSGEDSTVCNSESPRSSLASCASNPDALARELCSYAASGNLEAVRTILARGVLVNHVVDGNGTALHWAARMGREDVVRELLKSGADVGAANAQGDTPYAIARDWSPSRDVVRLLEQYSPRRSEAEWDR